MRPASPYRRNSAIALVFAAWCAAYGLPAELARSLTAQTVGFSQRSAVHPGKQAKVLLDRLSIQVRRSDHVGLPYFEQYLAPVLASPVTAGAGQLLVPAAAPRPQLRTASPSLFQRPPPASFPA